MYIDLFPVNSDWCEVLKIDQKLGIVKTFFSLGYFTLTQETIYTVRILICRRQTTDPPPPRR